MATCKLINPVNNKVYISRIKIAESWFSRLAGLLTRSGLASHEGLLLKPCKSVHTFGMRFSIDVIFTDKNNRIIKIRKNLKPFRCCFSSYKTRAVLELPAGSVERYKLECGNTLVFEQ